MTEAEWLESDDVRGMLVDLEREGPQRKLHLFACACFRRVWPQIADQRVRAAIEVVERFVDKKASREELLAARTGDHAALDVAQESGWYAAWYGCESTMYIAVNKKAERKEQAKLLRDILGNPFRPASLASYPLSWHGDLIVSIARQIYENRYFVDMPILADALEEAGCTNDDILNHCRQPGEHVRGCWVIDLLLGKE